MLSTSLYLLISQLASPVLSQQYAQSFEGGTVEGILIKGPEFRVISPDGARSLPFGNIDPCWAMYPPQNYINVYVDPNNPGFLDYEVHVAAGVMGDLAATYESNGVHVLLDQVLRIEDSYSNVRVLSRFTLPQRLGPLSVSFWLKVMAFRGVPAKQTTFLFQCIDLNLVADPGVSYLAYGCAPFDPTWMDAHAVVVSGCQSHDDFCFLDCDQQWLSNLGRQAQGRCAWSSGAKQWLWVEKLSCSPRYPNQPAYFMPSVSASASPSPSPSQSPAPSLLNLALGAVSTVALVPSAVKWPLPCPVAMLPAGTCPQAGCESIFEEDLCKAAMASCEPATCQGTSGSDASTFGRDDAADKPQGCAYSKNTQTLWLKSNLGLSGRMAAGTRADMSSLCLCCSSSIANAATSSSTSSADPNVPLVSFVDENATETIGLRCPSLDERFLQMLNAEVDVGCEELALPDEGEICLLRCKPGFVQLDVMQGSCELVQEVTGEVRAQWEGVHILCKQADAPQFAHSAPQENSAPVDSEAGTSPQHWTPRGDTFLLSSLVAWVLGPLFSHAVALGALGLSLLLLCYLGWGRCGSCSELDKDSVLALPTVAGSLRASMTRANTQATPPASCSSVESSPVKGCRQYQTSALSTIALSHPA
eukprot:g18293.t1